MYILRDEIKSKYLKENSLVLDIESSGVSREFSKVLVVGILDFEGNFIQYAIENEDEERDLLIATANILKGKHIISFNGQNFDLPFLKARMEKNGLEAFQESSQFDIYRYMINNKLITDFNKFALQDIEKFKNLNRNENFEMEEDASFYENIEEIDISKVLIHNKYDVINTESILSIVEEIEEDKKINIRYRDNDIVAKIERIKLDKNFCIVLANLENIDYEHTYENSNYHLSWSNDQLMIKIKVIEGYLKDNVLGNAHIIVDGEISLVDQSQYNLPKQVVPIFDGRYFLQNIKNLVREVFEWFIG